MKREPLMDEAYFNREIEYDDRMISRFEAVAVDATRTQAQRTRLLYDVYKKQLHALLLRYSRGDDVRELKPRFEPVIDAFERYNQAPGCEPSDFSSIDDYVTSLWLISLATLFDADDSLFKRVVSCIGNEGRDDLYERLVAARIAGRPKAGKLLYPGIYKLLLDAIDAPNERKIDLISRFLKGWYKSMKDVYWHDCHKGPEGGGFFGYWCLEAACVSKVCKVDATALRGLPYFPGAFLGG
jgi:hypothetical protein